MWRKDGGLHVCRVRDGSGCGLLILVVVTEVAGVFLQHVCEGFPAKFLYPYGAVPTNLRFSRSLVSLVVRMNSVTVFDGQEDAGGGRKSPAVCRKGKPPPAVLLFFSICCPLQPRPEQEPAGRRAEHPPAPGDVPGAAVPGAGGMDGGSAAGF